ncbi:hypothetical protein ASU32_23210 [Tsukamurella tyrosinosolvens]|nr:hypothetical protein ASU32_23210 [Tsukamurella tyrosinosolvens]
MSSNLAALRTARGITLRDMASRLTEAGVKMSAPTYQQVERGDTRVTVDLLTAAAAILDVSPVTLLLPSAVQGGDAVELTGIARNTVGRVWQWLRGDRSPSTDMISPEAIYRHRMGSYPRWLMPPEPVGDERDETTGG